MSVTAFANSFTHQTGRVIALGRTTLATVFLLTIWLDSSQPATNVEATYWMLGIYVVFSGLLMVATWRNWWMDARLAFPALAVDIALFALIVYSTQGYTSPYYLLFILPLLSAAIRWSWRETAVVALILVLLYLGAGAAAALDERFEEQRFAVRAAHLAILSAMLIGTSAFQRFTPGLRVANAIWGSQPDPRADPIEQATLLAMRAVGAKSGCLALRSGAELYTGTACRGGEFVTVEWSDEPRPLVDTSVALFDAPNGRLLAWLPNRRTMFARPDQMFSPSATDASQIDNGIVAIIQTGQSSGILFLGGIDDLSLDHITIGEDLAHAVGSFIDRHALLEAVEQGAAAQTRLSLARDVHDDVVQFLAGAAFRIEALIRNSNDPAVGEGLAELKGLVVSEQQDIRRYIAALRRGGAIDLATVAANLKSVADRLSQQWDIDVRFAASDEDVVIPIQLHLDLEQLFREAVANAARHGGAAEIAATLTVPDGALRFDIVDNGDGFSTPGGSGSPQPPWSITERAERAGGAIAIDTRPGQTRLSVTLPLQKIR